MGSVGADANFRKLSQFVPDYSPTRLTQYESLRTGMRIVVVDQEGPKLYGFFALATEIHDDSGAPHTLEHLCFMGSRSYQYKGFLDQLATRAYSSTNAWTATDHTAYTLETAGWAGFRQLLPVYLEHVILPTLTDPACTTEVHHIDGTGNDAGVVYSEMQGTQNTAAELIELRLKRLLYPEGVGFRYETGGMMEQLRVLSADRIRDFHRDMYQPRNLCLILTGEVNHEELLESLDDFEASILPHIPDPKQSFHRPWVDSKQPPWLEQSIIERVEFPEEDESVGNIEIRYLGPHVSDVIESAALSVISLYLCGSSASILDNTLVEREQLASGIYFSFNQRPKTEICISLSSVETANLETVEKRFHEVLASAVQNELDMSYMKDCVERTVRSIKFQAEGSSTYLAEAIISDYLFGNRDGSTFEDLRTVNMFSRTLLTWKEAQWVNFIRKYLVDANYVSILGVPSATLSAKIKKEESDRIEEQKKRLGPEGLKEKAEELEKAIDQNDREIPADLLAKFQVPPTDSIHFVQTSAARVGRALDAVGRPSNRFQAIVEHDGKDIPLFINFEQIPSNFVRIHLLISTEAIPVDLLPLVSIWLEAFFALPIRRGDKVIDFENVIIELERDTVGYDVELADVIGSPESLRITFQVEVEKYEVAIRWIKELLWNSVFDVERLVAINSRLLADVPDLKRSGDSMLTSCYLMTHLAANSIGRAKCTLVKALYLKSIKHLLKHDPQQVVEKMERLRASIGRFENFRVLVVADLDKLQHPVSAWQRSFISNDQDTGKPLTPLGRRLDRLSEAGRHLGQLAYVIPLPTIDSSYADAVTHGPTSYDDPMLPALLVALAYFNATEGPLWKSVRGVGLAYGASMMHSLESGQIHLDIYRSPDAYRAFDAVRRIVRSHMDGDVPFDPLMLEGAISSIVVTFANDQATLARAAVGHFVTTVIRGLPEDYRDVLLRKVRAVDADQIRSCLKNVVYNLFLPDKANILVTCAPGLQEPISQGLESAGFKPEIHNLTWFQDDYGIEVGDGADDEDDEDDLDDEGEDDEDGGASSEYEIVNPDEVK